jgi:NAD(P)-dependent dehydrogenase (short-subunit alcohol dehydrogenase family)
MKILVVGGTGIIGKAVVDLLKKEHEVIAIGKNGGDYQVDIESKSSIKKMFEDFKDVDGVISTTGMANIGPLNKLTDEDFDLAINNKLRGQVDLIRVAINNVKDNGFVVLTTGVAAHKPFPGGSAISMASAGLEGFVKAIELEKERNIKVNVVRPVMVTESAELWNLNVPVTVSAADTARVYKAVIELEESAAMYDVPECLKIIDNK